MLLNHLPISFSTQQFEGYRRPYESADQLRKMRDQLSETHFCIRDGDAVLLLPYHADGQRLGEAITLDTTANHGIANALARQALLRRFCEKNRSISGLHPVSFVRDSNLLKGTAAESFAVYPEYS